MKNSSIIHCHCSSSSNRSRRHCRDNLRRSYSSSSTTTTNTESSQNNNNNTRFRHHGGRLRLMLPPSSSLLSLGLLPSFVQQPNNVMTLLQQLPELQTVLSTLTSSSSSSSSSSLSFSHMQHQNLLERSVEIFGRFQSGSPEHLAVWALLAEYHQQRGEFDQVETILETMQTTLMTTQEQQQQEHDGNQDKNNSNKNKKKRLELDIFLAQAKVLWLQGRFEECETLCQNEFLRQPTTFQRQWPLHIASARTGQALARLVQAQTLDDAFSLRDPPRMVLRFLEQQQQSQYSSGTLDEEVDDEDEDENVKQQQQRSPSFATPPLALALAKLNYGCAHVIWADLVASHNQVDVPIDNAMRTWMEGVTLIKQWQKQKSRTSRRRNYGRNDDDDFATVLSTLIQGHLFANLAWGTLRLATTTVHSNSIGGIGDNIGDPTTTDTKKALELAGQALDSCNQSCPDGGPLLGRTLALVAKCYHQNQQAVTAEGLLRTALEETTLWGGDGGSTTTTTTTNKNVMATAGPQAVLDRYFVLETYHDLLHEWDRRETEAIQRQDQANELSSSSSSSSLQFPLSWQPMAQVLSRTTLSSSSSSSSSLSSLLPPSSLVMMSSLWFWTPNVFLEYGGKAYRNSSSSSPKKNKKSTTQNKMTMETTNDR